MAAYAAAIGLLLLYLILDAFPCANRIAPTEAAAYPFLCHCPTRPAIALPPIGYYGQVSALPASQVFRGDLMPAACAAHCGRWRIPFKLRVWTQCRVVMVAGLQHLPGIGIHWHCTQVVNGLHRFWPLSHIARIPTSTMNWSTSSSAHIMMLPWGARQPYERVRGRIIPAFLHARIPSRPAA